MNPFGVPGLLFRLLLIDIFKVTKEKHTFKHLINSWNCSSHIELPKIGRCADEITSQRPYTLLNIYMKELATMLELCYNNILIPRCTRFTGRCDADQSCARHFTLAAKFFYSRQWWVWSRLWFVVPDRLIMICSLIWFVPWLLIINSANYLDQSII